MNSKSCPVCGSRQVSVIEQVSMARIHKVWTRHYACEVPPLPAFHEQCIRMLACYKCSLEWASPCIFAQAEWYDQILPYPTTRWEYAVALRHIDRRAMVLELGCGPGHFLRHARESDITAMGFDINERAVQLAQADGLAAFQGDFKEALSRQTKRRDGSLIIVAFHFIEHIEHLAYLGFGLSRIAAEVHLSFPNPNRWTQYLLSSWQAGKHEMWNYPPWHQTRWNKDSIAAFAVRFGFQMTSYLEEPLDLSEVLMAVAEETGREAHECQTLVKKRLRSLAQRGTQIGGRSCYVRLRNATGGRRRTAVSR